MFILSYHEIQFLYNMLMICINALSSIGCYDITEQKNIRLHHLIIRVAYIMEQKHRPLNMNATSAILLFIERCKKGPVNANVIDLKIEYRIYRGDTLSDETKIVKILE